MTKILFSTVAAAAVLATSAMAYDITTATPLNYGVDTNAAHQTVSTTASTAINFVGSGNRADALIFPAYFAGNGWETTLRVTNTSTTNGVVAKVVLYAGNDSRELQDFNIYLSASDVWVGTIKVDPTDNTVRLISEDGSSPLQGTSGVAMASPTNKMITNPIAATSGYVEVIGCAMSTTTQHNTHAAFRSSYIAFAETERSLVSPIVYNNGVITSGAEVPAVRDNNATDMFTGVDNVLIGDVRITDTVNGKDMVMPAVKLQNVTEGLTGLNSTMLLFTEGEAANIADRNLIDVSTTGGKLTGYADYNATALKNDVNKFLMSNVFVNYGDSSSLVNNQVIFTSPFKRLLANAGQTTGYYQNVATGTLAASGATLTTVPNVTNYGGFSALALIYDQAETQASASQFSPATTPTMNFLYEVSATEGNSINTNNLSYYLDQAIATNPSFSKGFVNLQFLGNPAPTIATQMIATEAAGRVVTNWISPEWK